VDAEELPALPAPCPQVLPTGWIRYTSETVRQAEREAVAADREHQQARIAHITHERDQARADLHALLARQSHGDVIRLLREARATLETWKDIAPAVSLCADIDKVFAGQAASLEAEKEKN
jgi:hypothetical protein